jgi:ubiquinone/menaquinone biosynthesis C-methylase UbiE
MRSSGSAAGTAPDWEALAPVWHCFENTGSTYATLRAVLDRLRPPVLYAGGGRGRFPARLARQLGPGSVVTLDAAWGMVRRARTEFGLQCVQADVRAVPLRSGSVGSVFCATGVLEHLDRADRLDALRELARVTVPGGPIVLPTPPPGARAVDVRAEVEAWWSAGPAGGRTAAGTAFDAVAHVTGDRAAAYELLISALPATPAPLVGPTPDELAEAGLCSGLEVGEGVSALLVRRAGR